jgi:predicted nucleic acid-binding protein
LSTFFFADNTVLVSFAHIDRMDLLKNLIKDSGRWSHTVRRECRRSAKEPGLQALSQAENILGAPIRPTGDEVSNTFALRDQMASPGDDRYKHLGEAETMAIMSSRFSDSVFLTDDRRARDLARALGIEVASTWKLLSLICRTGLATEMEILDFLKDLRHRGAPVLNGISALRSWVASMKGDGGT